MVIGGGIMVIKENLSRKDFQRMAEIEALYYDSEYITDWEDSYDWYVFSKDTVVAVAEGNVIVAFMNLFPVSDEFYKVIYEGSHHEGYLDLDDVLRIRDGMQESYHLFLSCVAVHPDYRKSEALAMILDAYSQKYTAYLDAGYLLKDVVTHNVTEAGVSFSKRLGFQVVGKTPDGTAICAMPCRDFLAAAKIRAKQQLLKGAEH